MLEQNHAPQQMPELFCFGLLEAVDIKQLVALVAPRPGRIVNPSPRARGELKNLFSWYALLGKPYNPLKGGR